MVQEELANCILAYLPELDVNDNTQLLKALQTFGASYPLKATTLAGYGILNAYTKPETDWLLSQKANNAITLAGYGIGDAYTKVVIDAALAAINEALTTKQAAIDNLAATKQDKNTALMAANGWRLDEATGLLEQWGNGYCAPDGVTGAIDFPTPFAEVYNCFGNKVTPMDNTLGGQWENHLVERNGMVRFLGSRRLKRGPSHHQVDDLIKSTLTPPLGGSRCSVSVFCDLIAPNGCRV